MQDHYLINHFIKRNNIFPAFNSQSVNAGVNILKLKISMIPQMFIFISSMEIDIFEKKSSKRKKNHGNKVDQV